LFLARLHFVIEHASGGIIHSHATEYTYSL
jgi:hypothetical protein